MIKYKGKPEIFLWSDGKDDSKTVAEGDHEDVVSQARPTSAREGRVW